MTLLGIFSGEGARATGYSASSYASKLLGLVNDARRQHGLPGLVDTLGLGTVATAWSAHLGRGQVLSHNPELRAELESHGSREWTTYGENVGDAGTGDPNQVFVAYMRSPEHRANILDPRFRFVGVGVVFTGSTAWDTLDFVDSYSTTPAPEPSPAKAAVGAARGRATPEAPDPIATVDPPALGVQMHTPVRPRPVRATPSAARSVSRAGPRPPTMVIPPASHPSRALPAAAGRHGRKAAIDVAVALTLALIAGHWLVQGVRPGLGGRRRPGVV